MMKINEIVDFLKKVETSLAETKIYSKFPGIYAFFYTGQSFPILGTKVNKHQIIYIGKTESSQEKRDLKTHFSSGKTGSSTVRKSIGSLLFHQEKLKPIPRNESDYTRGKFSHFKFDDNGEKIITKWMKENLALSFYEYPKSKMEIDELETQLIDFIVPILNISKNPKNYFGDTLKKLRKTCAVNAAFGFNKKVTLSKPNLGTAYKSIINENSSGKYTALWQTNITSIKKILQNSCNSFFSLESAEFAKVGNRKNYSFNLVFTEGVVSNNVDSSAVARDLAKVMENDEEIRKILSSGHYKFSMGKDFYLHIKIS